MNGDLYRPPRRGRGVDSRNLRDELSPVDFDLLDDVVSRILSKVTAKSEFEIEVQVHDLMLKNVTYVNRNRCQEHTIEGPFLEKKGVCEGIAKAVKYLLDAKGVGCELVTGRLRSGNDLHMWNLVRVEGEWRHLDVTYDLGVTDGGAYRHDCFNLSDVEIMRSHEIIDSPHRCGRSRDSYYHRRGLVFDTRARFTDHIESELRAGRREVVFKIPACRDPAKVADEVFECTSEAMSRLGIGGTMLVTPNPEHLVYSVRVSES